MPVPEGYFSVSHGNTTVNVPRRLFQGEKAVLNEQEAEKFYSVVRGRYPWITPGSYKALLDTARKEFLTIRDEETGGMSSCRMMADEGDLRGAIRLLRRHLDEDPEDADAWNELGHLLCRTGDTDGGYKAFNTARKLYR